MVDWHIVLVSSIFLLSSQFMLEFWKPAQLIMCTQVLFSMVSDSISSALCSGSFNFSGICFEHMIIGFEGHLSHLLAFIEVADISYHHLCTYVEPYGLYSYISPCVFWWVNSLLRLMQCDCLKRTRMMLRFRVNIRFEKLENIWFGIWSWLYDLCLGLTLAWLSIYLVVHVLVWY